MILSRLTPAETLIVLKANNVPLQDLLKYTFMDLLLKQILMIDEVERQAHKRDPVKVYKYVSRGKNFQGYACPGHELVFLSVLQKNPALRILFKNFVRMGYENALSEKAYIKTIILGGQLKSIFSISIFQKFLGGHSYTREGGRLREDVKKEIEELEKTIPELMHNDRARALEILKLIGGNVFLLERLEFALLKEIDEALMAALNRQQAAGGCGTGWPTFGSFGDSFAGACSVDSGSGWGSGCSGDSGCSGGSGCSGCGGCGGD